MQKTWLIMLQELAVTFSRKSYIFFAFVLPVLAVAIVAIVKFVQQQSSPAQQDSTTAQEENQLDPEGFVDLSGLVKVLPPKLAEGTLVEYANEEQAKAALQAGEITAYYVIPDTYIAKGEIFYVYPPERSLIEDGQDWLMQWTLMINLLGGDVDAADRIWSPVWHLEMQNPSPQPTAGSYGADDCSRPGGACESNDLIRLLPSIMVVIFYITFMSSSSMLFTSVGSEKENRTIEVLLLSVSPRQVLAGKTIGISVAGFLQTVLWLGAILILLILGGQTLNLPENFSFPVDILVWSMVFFLGGYALYASLMAGAGAMIPKLKEAGAANTIAMLPLFVGYVVGLLSPLAGQPGAFLPVVLSIFPFTAPVVMVMRITDAMVPLWQILLSAGLTYLTAWLAFVAVSNAFHAQNLLSGRPFSVRRYLLAMTGKYDA